MATPKRYRHCILATACIPWNKDGSFAETIFRRQVRHLLKDLTRDIYIFGTAGEGDAVNERQFDRICRAFREETNQPGVQAMVGVISLALPTMIERIGRAREMGFRFFQISLPSWGALTEAETRRFFRTICRSFPDCGFLHYNLMRTKRLVTPDEYAVLAAENPNLVATKNSTVDMQMVQGLITKTPQLAHFLTEAGFAYGCQIGECGLLISIASVHFSRGRRYFEAGRKRNIPRLLEMQQELTNLTKNLTALGSKDAHTAGAYDKVFAKIPQPQFSLRML